MINQYALAKAKLAYILTEQGNQRDIKNGTKVKGDPLQSAIESYLFTVEKQLTK